MASAGQAARVRACRAPWPVSLPIYSVVHGVLAILFSIPDVAINHAV